MAFYKVAQVETIATASIGEDGDVSLTKSAGHNKISSYYLEDGTRELPLEAMLEKLADKYNISTDPRDYLFEAIRANTVNVPNENHDAFHKDELLRYDANIKGPVYMTYVGCPHHINHKADNDKLARGFVVDAHYNKSTPPLENCPTCGTKTLSKQARDRTGIHCARCGTVVKDEFVEILIAVDCKKEPKFAENVRRGILKAGSMGCECESTECNVCSHIAYSKPEFCEHIRHGNKGTYWRVRPNGKFEKISLSGLRNELVKRGYKGAAKVHPSNILTIRSDDGFEVRKAHEKCCFVVFKEYSRVHRPADPKAIQREIFEYRARLAEIDQNEELKNDTEILILKAKLQELEDKLEKAAGYSQDADLDTQVRHSPEGDEVVIREIDESVEPELEMGEGEEAEAPGGMSIKELTQQTVEAPEKPQDIYSMGALPVGGGAAGVAPTVTRETAASLSPSAEEAVLSLTGGEENMFTFEAMFQDWSADITDRGNIRVLDGSDAPIFLVKPKTKIASEQDGKKICTSILAHLLNNGITSTVNKFDGIFSPRIANVVEYAEDDYKGFEDKYMSNSATEDREDDIADTPTDKVESFTDAGHEMDVKKEDHHPTKGLGDSTLPNRETDFEDYRNDQTPESLSATDSKDSDMRDDPRKDFNIGSDDALGGYETDHTTKLSASEKIYTEAEFKAKVAEETEKLNTRYKKLFDKRLASKEKTVEEKIANLEGEIVNRFSRALKIVARRRQLNQQESPLKAQMFDTLANDRIVGRNEALNIEYVHDAMEPDLATHLIEAAYIEASEADINDLVKQAHEVFSYDENYLLSVEQDLGNIDQPLPVVASVVESQNQRLGPYGEEADRMRMEASRGNLEINPSEEPTILGSDSKALRLNDQKRDIRAALGNTRVASRANLFQRTAARMG